jgi:hypothetical protein
MVITQYLEGSEGIDQDKIQPNEDILLYEGSSEPIRYAIESGSVIVHFTKDGKPVLLEIMDASKFLAESARAQQRPKEPES